MRIKLTKSDTKDLSESRYFVQDLDRDDFFRRRIGAVWSPKDNGRWYAARMGDVYLGPYPTRKAAVAALVAAVPEGPPWPLMPGVNVVDPDGKELHLTVVQYGRDGVPDLNKVTVFDLPVRLGWVAWSLVTRKYTADRYPEGGDQQFENQSDSFKYLVDNPRRLRS